MLTSDEAALFPLPRLRGEGNKAASLEAICKFMPISNLYGSGNTRWLEFFGTAKCRENNWAVQFQRTFIYINYLVYDWVIPPCIKKLYKIWNWKWQTDDGLSRLYPVISLVHTRMGNFGFFHYITGYNKLLHFAFYKYCERFNVKRRVAECVVTTVTV